MKVKLFAQILLFFLAITLLTFTIYFYFYNSKDSNELSKNKLIKEEIKLSNIANEAKIVENDNYTNLMKNVIYENIDNDGNKYKIEAITGRIDGLESIIINMSGVKATIMLSNSNIITILSDVAIFNNKNFETKFSKNVKFDYLTHHLEAENLDLLFDTKLIEIKNKFIYKNLDTEMAVDRIIIDLVTKNSKIFMNDSSKKIKILKNN